MLNLFIYSQRWCTHFNICIFWNLREFWFILIFLLFNLIDFNIFEGETIIEFFLIYLFQISLFLIDCYVEFEYRFIIKEYIFIELKLLLLWYLIWFRSIFVNLCILQITLLLFVNIIIVNLDCIFWKIFHWTDYD